MFYSEHIKNGHTLHNGAVNVCAAVWECGDDPGHCVSLNGNRIARFL